jgi:hypothetical protein
MHDDAKFWSAEDSIMLLKLLEEHGHEWKILGSKLNRTASSVRNRVQRMERGKNATGNIQLCSKCGQPRRGHICTNQFMPPPATPAVENILSSEELDEILDAFYSS